MEPNTPTETTPAVAPAVDPTPTPTETPAVETPAVEPQTPAASETPSTTPTVEDDDITAFAKGQGFDPENLTDETRRALQLAKKNQDAFRNRSTPTVEETKADLSGPLTAEDKAEFEREFAQYKYQKETDAFWAQEGKNRELEPVMVEILKEKETEYGKDYAYKLSRDLNLLHDLAQLKTGKTLTDPEAIRQEERERQNRQQGTAPTPSAVETKPALPTEITREWIINEYDPKNPEHVALVDSLGKQ